MCWIRRAKWSLSDIYAKSSSGRKSQMRLFTSWEWVGDVGIVVGDFLKGLDVRFSFSSWAQSWSTSRFFCSLRWSSNLGAKALLFSRLCGSTRGFWSILGRSSSRIGTRLPDADVHWQYHSSSWSWRSRVTRRSQLTPFKEGMKILDSPSMHQEYVRTHFRNSSEVHRDLLDWMPTIPDLQDAWMLLLFCVGSRTNYLLRVDPPNLVEDFVTEHDDVIRRSAAVFFHRESRFAQSTSSELSRVLGQLGPSSGSACRSDPWSPFADSCDEQGTFLGFRIRSSSLDRLAMRNTTPSERAWRWRVWCDERQMTTRSFP